MKKIFNYNTYINESVRDMLKPKTEEEIDLAIKSSVEVFLETAYKTGFSKSRIGFLAPEYKKYLSEYILNDGLFDIDVMYLLYKGKVFILESIPGGDYYTQLNTIPESIDELKVKLKEMLNKLG